MAQEELNAADQEKITGIAIIYFSVVTIIFYFLVKNALSVIRSANLALEMNLTIRYSEYLLKKLWRRY